MIKLNGVVVAILDGVPDSSGDILTDNFRVSGNPVPVVLDFHSSPLDALGYANVYKSNGLILADITFTQDRVYLRDLEDFFAVVGCQFLTRQGNRITDWIINEVCLTKQPFDERLPRIADKSKRLPKPRFKDSPFA